jgi:hypothetical protein
MPADVVAPAEALDLASLAPVSLEEVVDGAARLTRVDRKYLVPRATAQELLDELSPAFRLLTISGRSSTGYRSTYFDTPELASCRAHVQRRRSRWKARSRLYVEDGLCRVEVKTKDGRGATVKHVRELTGHRYGALEEPTRAFIAASLEQRGITLPDADLRASAEVSYRRITLADTRAHERVTLDWDVSCSHGGQRVWLDPSWVLVETKAGARPSAVDRALIRLGVRARPFSKYVSAVSLLRDDVADNDVRRLHGTVLHSTRSATEEIRLS